MGERIAHSLMWCFLPRCARILKGEAVRVSGIEEHIPETPAVILSAPFGRS